MPILDHRSHRSKGSEGTASLASNASVTIGVPSMNGTTANGNDLGSPEQRLEEIVDPVQALNNQLQVENRIREGAENLLQMPLDDALRQQVESELEMARSKIDAIVKKIENHNAREARKAAAQVNGDSHNKRKFNGTHLHHTHRRKDEPDEKEDFRSALQLATGHIRTLHSLNNQGAATSPPNSPSSSTAPSVPTDADVMKSRVEAMNHLIDIMQRNLRVRYDINIPDVIQAILPALSDRATKLSRATAYRLIRHMLVNSQSVERLQEYPIDWYMVKSLSRDIKHAVEKEQVIKLIRAIVEIGSSRRGPGAAVGTGTVPLSDAVMRAFMAIAEHPDEPFRLICLQTLTEILLIDVSLVARTGCVRLLLHVLAEGPVEMAPIISSAFLYIVDSPKTRAYLNPGTDLEMALSGVTDAYGKGPEHVDKMRTSTKLITAILRSWSGLLYLCVNDKVALRALVDGLRIPSLQTREIIIDLFFDLFNIKPPEWHQAFIDGRRLTMYRKARRNAEIAKTAEVPTKQQDVLKITDQYIGLLILVFTNAGLMDALTAMLEETVLEESATGSNLSRKATLLIAEILHTANRVLPLRMAARIQSLPRVFSLASDYSVGDNRAVGTSAFSAIESYNRHRMRVQPSQLVLKDTSRPRANSVEEAVRRGQRQVEQARIKAGMQMDDKTFQTLLLDSQVMTTKDQTKWVYDILLDLVEGPFLHPKRMEEAIKVSRYIRKLMSFYHPFNHRFSDLAKSQSNIRWVRLGCLLLNALMASAEGLRFLAEDEFLGQLVRGFAQLDPTNDVQGQEALFSKRRMTETLTYGYLEMIGVLSKRKEGLELMEKLKLFTAFYHLSELRGRDDLIKAMIDSLDYSIDGHSRIVLSKTLTSSYRDIRLYATNHLGELVRNSTQINTWMIRLLVTQLYDPEVVVQEAAVRYLEKACETPDTLQLVVETQPLLEHLGDVGHPLMLKFLSTSTGFRYLFNGLAGSLYVPGEMESWFHERNMAYVIGAEVCIAKAFGVIPEDPLDLEYRAAIGLPPHFYGVLVKTDDGCQILQTKGHFADFVQFIRKHGFESEDPELIMKLKSVLWAVGNIGASERGLPFLEEEEIIPVILEIAERSLVLSVRGTCFFVLGLISSTPQGAEILDDYHWEATLSPLGLPTGLCVPSHVDQFVSIPAWEPIRDQFDEVRLEPPETEEENEVLTAIYNLANTVIANAASRTLARMKTKPKYKHIFSSTEMLYRALHAITSQRYRLPVRRYILDLFNIEFDDQVVKELAKHAEDLKIKPADGDAAVKTPQVVSIVGRPPRHRRISDSDEESVTTSDDEDMPDDKRHPVIKTRPMSQIVGF